MGWSDNLVIVYFIEPIGISKSQKLQDQFEHLPRFRKPSAGYRIMCAGVGLSVSFCLSQCDLSKSSGQPCSLKHKKAV